MKVMALAASGALTYQELCVAAKQTEIVQEAPVPQRGECYAVICIRILGGDCKQIKETDQLQVTFPLCM